METKNDFSRLIGETKRELHVTLLNQVHQNIRELSNELEKEYQKRNHEELANRHSQFNQSLRDLQSKEKDWIKETEEL
jgi:hypothetical protein